MSSNVGVVVTSFNQQLVHKVAGDSKSAVVRQTIHTSDFLVVTQDTGLKTTDRTITLAPSADITIYADTLRIAGPIEAKGRTVRIYARVLEAAADSKGRPAGIHVDGEDGTGADKLPVPKAVGMWAAPKGIVHCVKKNIPPTHGYNTPTPPIPPAIPGGHGHGGHAAGSITIRCSEVANPAKFVLELSANGGRGGDGARGQGGGEGGKGGNGDDAFQCCLGAWNIEGQDGAPGGDGGTGGDGGDAGYGGNGGAITFLCESDAPTGVTGQVKSGASGTPGAGGSGGDPGPGGDGGKGIDVLTGGGSHVAPIQLHIAGGQTGPAGHRGKDGGSGTVSQGKKPAAGSFQCAKQTPEQVFPASHEMRPWLNMILNRADYDFIAAGDDETSPHLQQAGLRYQWLARLSQSHHQAKSTVDSGVLSVFHTANIHLSSISAGHNYFGKSADFVPLGGKDYWTGEVDDALADLQDFEPRYQNYLDLAKDQQTRVTEIKSALSASKARIAALQRREADVLASLPGLTDTIDQLDYDIQADSNALTTAMQTLQSEINAAIGLSPTDFIKAIGSLAYYMGGSLNKTALIAGKVLDLGYQGISDVVADDGTKIKKSYLVNKILMQGKDFSQLDEGFRMAFHLITPSDPHRVKLLQEKKDLDRLLDKIASWKQAKAVRQDLDSYVSKVSARNKAVLEYNSVVKQALKIEADIHTEIATSHELAGQAANIDPDLPHAAVYMTFVYKLICARFVDNLYNCLRAAAFWAVDDTLSLSAVTGGATDPRQITYTTAKAWVTQTKTLLSNAHESLGKQSHPAIQDIVISLDESVVGARFADLKAGKCSVLHFTLPPVLKQTSLSESPFAQYSNVRTSKVQIILRGATTTDPTFKLDLKQLGNENVAASSNRLMSASHQPRGVPFEYSIDAATGNMQVKTPGDNLLLADKEYAPLGPFADWSLTITPAYNPGINLTALTSIDLVFSGRASTFD